jgi:hypothetical protein
MTTQTNVARAFRSVHPLDTPRIRAVAQLVVKRPLTDCEVEKLWQLFSSDRRGIWLPVLDEALVDFRDWCSR